MSNRDDVLSLVANVESSQGAIAAIVHGAAANQTRRAEAATADSALVEVSPKCLGLAHLLEACDMNKIKAVVGFSSIIGTMGMPGNAW